MAMILAGTSISVVYFSKHNGECYVESKMLSVSVNAKSVVYELMSNRFRYQGLSVPPDNSESVLGFLTSSTYSNSVSHVELTFS